MGSRGCGFKEAKTSGERSDTEVEGSWFGSVSVVNLNPSINCVGVPKHF